MLHIQGFASRLQMHHCRPFTCPSSVLELPAVWMAAPCLAFHLALTLKDSSCQMSKRFHHRLTLPTGTPALFFCPHGNAKNIKAVRLDENDVISFCTRHNNNSLACVVVSAQSCDSLWFVRGAVPLHMTSSRLHGTCVRRADALSLSPPPSASLAPVL